MNIKRKLSELDHVHKIVDDLRAINILPRLSGHCIAAADIVQNMLDDQGIPAKLVECKLSIFTKDGSGNETLYFVGYDGLTDPNPSLVDTHVVAVTVSDRPILIDLSIGELLPKGVSYVADYINSTDPDVIARFEFGDMIVTYRPKSKTRYPQLHQKTLLARIKEEVQVKHTLSVMKWLIVAGFLLGAVNLFLNIFNISLKFI